VPRTASGRFPCQSKNTAFAKRQNNSVSQYATDPGNASKMALRNEASWAPAQRFTAPPESKLSGTILTKARIHVSECSTEVALELTFVYRHIVNSIRQP